MRLHRRNWVYTCQNATLLEITWHGSNRKFLLKTTLQTSEIKQKSKKPWYDDSLCTLLFICNEIKFSCNVALQIRERKLQDLQYSYTTISVLSYRLSLETKYKGTFIRTLVTSELQYFSVSLVKPIVAPKYILYENELMYTKKIL